MSLNTKAWRGVAFLAMKMALLLFGAAGTIRYWQAWTYLGVFLAGSVFNTHYLIKNDRVLLRRRINAGPAAGKKKPQNIRVLSYLGSIALMVVPGLDHRFSWSLVPTYLSLTGNALVVLGYYITFLVYKENPFGSATIEIAKDHRVISTGPYRIVRHPMYAGGLLFFLGTPLALDSYWAFLAGAATLPALIWRVLDEEKFLSKNLPGYAEYRTKVEWRLIPGVL